MRCHSLGKIFIYPFYSTFNFPLLTDLPSWFFRFILSSADYFPYSTFFSSLVFFSFFLIFPSSPPSFLIFFLISFLISLFSSFLISFLISFHISLFLYFLISLFPYFLPSFLIFYLTQIWCHDFLSVVWLLSGSNLGNRVYDPLSIRNMRKFFFTISSY